MRIDEIAPRGSVTQTESYQKRIWPFNPAFGGLFFALIAGLFVESAFQSYQTGPPFAENNKVNRA